MVDMGFIPDVVTDQTSAHDELNGYVPSGIPYEEALELRKSNPDLYMDMALNSMAVHCRAILDMRQRGAVAFDYGNNLRGQAYRAGVKNAFDYPGFVPGIYSSAFLRGGRSVPLGRPLRRSRRHSSYRQRSHRSFSAQGTDGPMAQAGRAKGRAYGAPGPHLLARLRRAG